MSSGILPIHLVITIIVIIAIIVAVSIVFQRSRAKAAKVRESRRESGETP